MIPPRVLLRDEESVRLRVRLTPNAPRDSVGPFEELANGENVLAARVRAVPEDGAANAALEEMLARGLGIAKSRVSVVSGHASRIKTVRIEGDPNALETAVLRLVRG
ncbi:DUF167 family protein [Prosthecomicrobium sp. N25]|uniref:DUF167 family protein n=1 Tax=Prosthecomicrobium sp. N25 TaxID=3129254 RepID=UPI0030775FA8